jgi:Predicted transcriptional regulators
MSFQIGSSLLDACVLSILNKEDTYGYRLTQEIKEVLGISESTLYPVLRRLEKDGYLEIYDEAVMGRNRRYYRITDEGKEQHHYFYESWIEFSEKIGRLLKGGNEDEQG